ncbi:MAG TPA: DUF3891 family protein [Lacipirellulaceae bacterium]|jgi:hypothetical protein|nr:DUF3891 family protein [Lacipirellulaceae bacterium]
MIRREIELAEGERLWLLISQVDHAHISGELTRNLDERFSHEVIEAITHHDDGWAEWEAAPKMNPEIGGPYSFLEMPTESLAIWDRSIAAARKIGPLAGFIVAGHFYNLSHDSERAQQPAMIAWMAAKRKERTAWLAEWVRKSATHTVDEAKRAQEQLQTADLFSLWLCCDAPLPGESADTLENSAMKVRAEKLLEKFRFSVIGSGRKHPTPDDMTEAIAWVIAVEPYPFGTAPISLSLRATAAPKARYTSWEELQAASRPIVLRWRLMPPVPPEVRKM